MLLPRDPAHYLGTLKTTTIPKRLLWLDCAHTSRREEGAWVRRWEAGALGATWYTSKKHVRKDKTRTFDTPSELWTWADEFIPSSRRVVLWSYDLAEQLRISQALTMLPKLGWHLDKIVLERTAAWASFLNGKRSLLMCDLKSWTPVEFGRIISELGDDSEVMDPLTAGPNYQTERCFYRCQIIRDAVLQILEWVQAENLGPFRPTGSGQSYAGYRRRFLTSTLLVHDDHERLHAERLAMWTGRCEAWQHGKLDAGPYVEYDMRAAYCQIAADSDVPTVAQGEIRARKLEKVLEAAESHAILTHVTLTTDAPIVPTRLAGRTLWPVGTFSTWLWEPELRLVAQHAHNVKIHRVYRYQRGPALQGFARFVLDGLSGQTQIYGNVPALVLKLWSRCLVGRLGLRYRQWVPFGTCPIPDVRLVTFADCDEQTITDMLVAGNDRLILNDMAEAPESLPQIPSWVMSECRRRLWETMEVSGFSTVVYVDTDSVITTRNRSLLNETLLGQYLGEAWTLKGTYKSLTIHGPRNLTKDSDRVVSGLPLTARQVAPLEFTGEVMRSIKESMRAGELDCVASLPRSWKLNAPDLRREHLHNHKTAPFRVQLP